MKPTRPKFACTDKNRLIHELIECDKKEPKRIAVVGDAMLDVYVNGRLDGCQEDCLKFVEESRVEVSGGAWNACGCLHRWPGAGELVAFFSGDPYPVKTRFLVNGKHVFRHDVEKPITDRRRLALFLREVPDAVLISDYDKGFLSDDDVKYLITECGRRNIICVVDTKRDPNVYRLCEYGDLAILKANRDYAEKYGAEFIDVVTDGGGMPTVNGAKLLRHASAAPIVNHVGAGDCFAAHLTLALAHGFHLNEAAIIAHSAGRVYVQHPHNRAPWSHEIARDFDPVGGKVLNLDSLSMLRKSITGRIVFTNGVFRLPHAGHAWLMDWARKQGDVLVVGVNDDASAARLRPQFDVRPLAERCQVLGGLTAVDWIVPFGEDTVENVIRELQPDVLVKGNDYEGIRLDGQELVKEVRVAPPSPYSIHSSDLCQ